MNHTYPIKLWMRKLFAGEIPSMTGSALMWAFITLGTHKMIRGTVRSSRILERLIL